MTDTDRRTDGSTTQTIGDVSHTHPHTDRGALNKLFERGKTIVADGGEREGDEGDRRQSSSAESEPERTEGDEEDETQMSDVDHTPPHGDGVDRVFERGQEEPVESEE